jgi:hypothetical protein
MTASPISLIQWLEPDEYREAQDALNAFEHEVNIYHADVLTKQEAKSALEAWFRDGSGNKQYCFLGAHGITDPDGTAIGIGSSGKPDRFVSWEELWNWYSQWELEGGLWLGACKSSEAAAALSPFLRSGPVSIRHFYGFSKSIYPDEIRQVLQKLLEFTRIESLPYLDEELALLRAAIPGTTIELHYAAHTLAGVTEFVNVDEMPEKLGITFRQLLENNGRLRI